jgi:hypothetical protein
MRFAELAYDGVSKNLILSNIRFLTTKEFKDQYFHVIYSDQFYVETPLNTFGRRAVGLLFLPSANLTSSAKTR